MKEKIIKEIIENLRKRHWIVGVMESCTGGAVANSITNIPGASDVFKEGLITYSDEAKIKAGVDKNIIEKYGVYSVKIAEEMARKIKGEVGIGVTGELPGIVYVSVKVRDKIESEKLEIKSLLTDKIKARKEMKREVVVMVFKMIIKELK